MEKCFEEKWKKLFRKGIYLGELSFFPRFFFFNLIWTDEQIQKTKEKSYSTQYPVWQPYYQFVN